MINEILNHMNEEELRNYAFHCEEAIESAQQLCFAQQELLQAWKQVIVELEFQQLSLTKRNEKIDELRRIDNEMYKKYEQYMPRPVCDSNRGES